MTAQEAVNAQVAGIVAVNDALYSAAVGGDSSLLDRVDVWHRQALVWIDLGGKVAQAPDAARAREWARLGDKLAGNARDIADLARSSTVRGRVEAFAAGMPDALAATLRAARDGSVAVAQGVGDVAGASLWAVLGAVPWPLYLVGGGLLVLAGYLLVSGRAAALVSAAKP